MQVLHSHSFVSQCDFPLVCKMITLNSIQVINLRLTFALLAFDIETTWYYYVPRVETLA